MTRLKLTLARSKQTILKWAFILLLPTVCIIQPTPVVFAFDAAFSMGNYEPADGVVKDLFSSSYTTTVKAKFQYYETFDWIISYSSQKMESRVSNLETELTMDTLNYGFEKILTYDNDNHTFKPYIGMGLSLVRLKEVLEAETTGEKSDTETYYVSGSFWSVGLLAQIWETTALEFNILEQRVDRNVFGNVHIGGRIISLGVIVGVFNE